MEIEILNQEKMDNYNFTKGKWKHKKGKRAKFEYDNFIIDEYGNHIVKWSNTGNGSHKLTMKESHANGLLISKAPILLDKHINDIELLENILKENPIGDIAFKLRLLVEEKKQLIKEATEL